MATKLKIVNTTQISQTIQANQLILLLDIAAQNKQNKQSTSKRRIEIEEIKNGNNNSKKKRKIKYGVCEYCCVLYMLVCAIITYKSSFISKCGNC